MDLGLTGKNAVVLGGTRGIGRAIVETLIQEGANVALCARNASQVAEAVSTLSATGGHVSGDSVDVTDGPALQAWIKRTGAAMGGIDVLVSNAGAMAQGFDAASWEQNFKLDVLGAVHAFEAAQPFLTEAAKAKGDAAFVIIASVSAAVADQASSYGPIKASLIHMAKGLARQHAGVNLRTNVVSPGMVYFDGGVWQMVEQGNPDFFKKALSRNPTGRCASPQDVANAAVFLASPAASYITGVNLLVDGSIANRVNF